MELPDSSKPKAIGNHNNIPMAERATELLYSGDRNLEKFKEEYPFCDGKKLN
ncbi:hypothetical protein Cflav_PD1977 [Pedosphaera parvula Ellin514]|uniref:Uncharacterized protein n=1 Tax=Pedosphaera parvula (strain Ellin514) TaxID=320771 RepID=B9XN08_PEDPL|nr:hypothetical protein Cflav_PD1977 [Pedosphaera parvula Ellin514]